MKLSRSEASDAGAPNRDAPLSRGRKPYRTPVLSRLSPDEAKALLERADRSDPAVQQMLDRIEVLRKKSREIT